MHDIHFPTTKDLFYIQKKVVVVVVAPWHSSVDAILSKEENDCEGKGASSKPLKKIDDDDPSGKVFTRVNASVKRRKDQNTTRGRKQYYVLLVVFYTSLRM